MRLPRFGKITGSYWLACTANAGGIILWMSFAGVGELRAQPAPEAAPVPDSVAQKLANESLGYLRQGDEATDDGTKKIAYRRGMELAEKAIAADDRNADAHFAMFANQGRMMVQEGYTATPFTFMTLSRELNRTLELDPNHADALAAKGGVYRQLPWVLGGSKKKASEYLARSVEVDYEHACGARIELAELYSELGQPERSIPLLEKAIEVATRDGKSDKLERARALLAELAASKDAEQHQHDDQRKRNAEQPK